MRAKDVLLYGCIAALATFGIGISILGEHPSFVTVSDSNSNNKIEIVDEDVTTPQDDNDYELEFYSNYSETLLEDEDVEEVEVDDRIAFAHQQEKPVFVLDSANVVSLIAEMEGWRSKAYRCPKGVLTIGYGITAVGVKEVNRLLGTNYKRVHEGDRITKDESIKFMLDYCKCADTYFKKNYKGWRQVLPYVKTSIMSYCYQKGWYGFSEKVCGKENKWRMNQALRDGDNDMIIKLLEDYTLNDGYTNRRTTELKNAKKIYNTLYYTALKDWKMNSKILEIKF